MAPLSIGGRSGPRQGLSQSARLTENTPGCRQSRRGVLRRCRMRRGEWLRIIGVAQPTIAVQAYPLLNRTPDLLRIVHPAEERLVHRLTGFSAVVPAAATAGRPHMHVRNPQNSLDGVLMDRDLLDVGEGHGLLL